MIVFIKILDAQEQEKHKNTHPDIPHPQNEKHQHRLSTSHEFVLIFSGTFSISGARWISCVCAMDGLRDGSSTRHYYRDCSYTGTFV
jgi:hypothetical protein